eukprot:TCONS_00067954-protein
MADLTTLVRDIFINGIPFIMHCIGLYFLVQVRHVASNTNAIQYIYFVVISINNVLSNGLIITLNVLTNTNPQSKARVFLMILANGGLFVSYALVMTLLTIDRFLEIYFNIEYPVVWSKLKTEFCIFTCYIIAFLLSAFLAVTRATVQEVMTVLPYYVWPTCEMIFIIPAFITYGYVLHKIHMNRKRFAGTVVIAMNRETITVDGESQAGSHTSHHASRRNFIRILRGFFIPTLFVSTFLLFWVLPDMIYLGFALAGKQAEISEAINTSCAVLYALAPVSDALIYTFAFQPVRQRMLKVSRDTYHKILKVFRCGSKN